jgi:hypothetical protein
LQARAGLIDEDVNPLALLVGHTDHAQSGSIIHGGQRTRIAMVQDALAGPDQGSAVSGHTLVDLDVFVGQRLGIGQDRISDVVHVGQILISGHAQHTIDRPEKIDSRGTCLAQHIGGHLQIP